MDIFETDIVPIRPFNFGLSLAYLRTSPSAILEKIQGMDYSRAISIDGKDVVVHITHDDPIDQTTLHVQVVGERVDDVVADRVILTIKRIFTLDVDPLPFHNLYAHDPVLGGYMQSYRGLRPALIADPYESLLWAIIGQQVSVQFARKLKLALVDLCGRKLRHGDTDYWLVPHPRDVATLNEELLRRLQMSRQKARTIIDASEAVASGDLDLFALMNLEYDEARDKLMQFKGIGRWTAEYVLMRGLGFPDVIPAADVGLQSIIGRTYGFGRKATEEQVRQLAVRWAPWRGWAAFLWWFQLQTEEFVKQLMKSQEGKLS